MLVIFPSSQIVIELDGNNEKAWYRRGQACIRLKDFERAKTSFLKVTSISGGQYPHTPDSRVSYNGVLMALSLIQIQACGVEDLEHFRENFRKL